MNTAVPIDGVARRVEEPHALSKGRIWTGRVLTGFTALFMLLDAVGKLVMPVQVVQACERLGFPVHLSPTLGIILLASTLLYVVPRTMVLGAVLLTGYLGGACAIQLRAGSPVFETIFPALFGIVAWAGLYLRDERVGQMLPLVSKR